MGYSTGHWEGGTLLVDSVSYNDKTRLPGGHIHSEACIFKGISTAVTSLENTFDVTDDFTLIYVRDWSVGES
jgi:hypothetical protein